VIERATALLPEELAESPACIGEAVLQPDGQVVEPYEARFPDEVAWRAEMEKRAKARREAAAAAFGREVRLNQWWTLEDVANGEGGPWKPRNDAYLAKWFGRPAR
jgi:hypothetical protein